MLSLSSEESVICFAYLRLVWVQMATPPRPYQATRRSEEAEHREGIRLQLEILR